MRRVAVILGLVLFGALGACTPEDGREGDAAAYIRELATRLAAPDVETRRAAAHELAERGPRARGAELALAEALGDRDTDVRVYAMLALGGIGSRDPQALPRKTIRALIALQHVENQRTADTAVAVLDAIRVPPRVAARRPDLRGFGGRVESACVAPEEAYWERVSRDPADRTWRFVVVPAKYAARPVAHTGSRLRYVWTLTNPGDAEPGATSSEDVPEERQYLPGEDNLYWKLPDDEAHGTIAKVIPIPAVYETVAEQVVVGTKTDWVPPKVDPDTRRVIEEGYYRRLPIYESRLKQVCVQPESFRIEIIPPGSSVPTRVITPEAPPAPMGPAATPAPDLGAPPAGEAVASPGRAPRTDPRRAPRTYARPGFDVFLAGEQLWVFATGSPGLMDFLERGEPAKRVARSGVGPDDRTVMSTDAETLDAYLMAMEADTASELSLAIDERTEDGEPGDAFGRGDIIRYDVRVQAKDATSRDEVVLRFELSSELVFVRGEGEGISVDGADQQAQSRPFAVRRGRGVAVRLWARVIEASPDGMAVLTAIATAPKTGEVLGTRTEVSTVTYDADADADAAAMDAMLDAE